MSHDPAANEFSRTPVPDSIGVSGWRIALIKIGVLIALPAFIMGAELGFTLGFKRSMIAFFSGAAILFVIAAATTTVGARSRLSTSMLVQAAFGRMGAKLVNLILALTLMGWFGVTAELFGITLERIAGDAFGLEIWRGTYIICGGFLMIATTIFGIQGLQRLADMAVPLLLIALVIVAYYGFLQAAPGAFSVVPETAAPIGIGISAVVGSMAAGVTIFPDVARFARNTSHGRLSAFLTLAVGVPMVLGLSAIPSIATGEGNLLSIMVMLGLGIPAFLLLVFAAWTSNTGNLYSSSLMMATVLRQLRQRTIVISIGVIGITMAILGISDYLIPYLLMVGFSIPPIASVYVVDYALCRGGRIDESDWDHLPAFRVPALVAWGSGIVMAVMTSKGLFTLTTIPACDSILTALTIYVVSHRLGWTQINKPAIPAASVVSE